MLDAPALELPSSSVITYTLRDVPRRHRFAVMRKENYKNTKIKEDTK